MIDYTVSFNQGSGTTFVVLASGITATSYTATGLTAGTTYAFSVQARNLIGLGLASS